MVVKCRIALGPDGPPPPPQAAPCGSAPQRELETPRPADVVAATTMREALGDEAGQLDPHRGGILRRSGNHESLTLHLASAAAPACRMRAVLGLRIVAHDVLRLAERAFLIGMRPPVEDAAGFADLEGDQLHGDAG